MENIKSEGPLTFNTRINSTSFHSTNAFLNLHLQVIPYANLEGKTCFCFYSVFLCTAIHTLTERATMYKVRLRS